MYKFLEDGDKIELLKLFIQGDKQSLFDAIFESINNRELLKDGNFFISLLISSDEKIKKKYLDKYIDEFYNFDKIIEVSDENLKKINNFWFSNLENNMPIYLAIIPFLSDNLATEVLSQSNVWDLGRTDDKTMPKNLLITFFMKNMPESLAIVKNEWVFSNIEWNEQEDFYGLTTTLKEYIKKVCDDNYNMLSLYAQFNYLDNFSVHFEWLKDKMENPVLNKIKIKDFLKDKMSCFDKIEQERLIALTLYNNSNFSLTKYGIKLLGYNNLKDYIKSAQVPLWIEVNNSNVLSSVSELGYDPLEFFEHADNFLLNKVFELDVSNYQYVCDYYNITKEKIFSQLLKKYTFSNSSEISYCSLFSYYLNNKVNHIFKFDISELNDLNIIDDRYKNKKYELLSDEEKLDVLNNFLNKTIFQKSYTKYSKFSKNYESNKYNLSELCSDQSLWIISEHIRLLDKFNIKNFNDKYSNYLENLFDSYSIYYLDIKSKTYDFLINIINFLSNDDLLDWPQLSEKMTKLQEKRANKYNITISPSCKNIISLVSSIALNKSLDIKSEKKKIKI